MVEKAVILATLLEVLEEASMAFQGVTGVIQERVLLVAVAVAVRAAAWAARAAPVTLSLAVRAEQLLVRMVKIQPR